LLIIGAREQVVDNSFSEAFFEKLKLDRKKKIIYDD
jgi:hypothetical protein